MGFLETLGGIVKKGSETLNKMNNELNNLYEEYQFKEDRELIRLAKSGNFNRKMAALKVLKEHGYTKI